MKTEYSPCGEPIVTRARNLIGPSICKSGHKMNHADVLDKPPPTPITQEIDFLMSDSQPAKLTVVDGLIVGWSE